MDAAKAAGDGDQKRDRDQTNRRMDHRIEVLSQNTKFIFHVAGDSNAEKKS